MSTFRTLVASLALTLCLLAGAHEGLAGASHHADAGGAAIAMQAVAPPGQGEIDWP